MKVVIMVEPIVTEEASFYEKGVPFVHLIAQLAVSQKAQLGQRLLSVQTRRKECL
jgi:hypothetical protein